MSAITVPCVKGLWSSHFEFSVLKFKDHIQGRIDKALENPMSHHVYRLRSEVVAILDDYRSYSHLMAKIRNGNYSVLCLTKQKWDLSICEIYLLGND